MKTQKPCFQPIVSRSSEYQIRLGVCWFMNPIARFLPSVYACIQKNLLSPHDYLDVIQFVQRLHGRQVVDVERQYLVANLTKNWVIELEE